MDSSFNQLGIIPPILRALEDMGFQEPTEVQEKAIPHILNNEDLIVMSKTGSGKTAVFGVSMLQLINPEAPGPQGLILSPTRELAVQVDSDLKKMAAHLNHKTAVVYGQHSMNTELQALSKGVSIVTGTPGRVFDHVSHGNLVTKNIRFLVLDEADRMLDMGFLDQVVRIIKTLPKNRITMLFSATIPNDVRRICREYMKQPITIEVESPTKTVDSIKQSYYRVEPSDKRTQLNRLLLFIQPESCMIFCNTKIAVDRVQSFLEQKGYSSQALHGDIPQSKRTETIQKFKAGQFHILVATDVAARGLHINELSLVINYDVPMEKDSYVHRIGRTGRAGNDGLAATLVTTEDIMSLYEIEEHIGAIIEEAQLPSDEDLQEKSAGAEVWRIANALPENHIRTSSQPRHRDLAAKRPGSMHSVKAHPLKSPAAKPYGDKPAAVRSTPARKPAPVRVGGPARAPQQTSASSSASNLQKNAMQKPVTQRQPPQRPAVSGTAHIKPAHINTASRSTTRTTGNLSTQKPVRPSALKPTAEQIKKSIEILENKKLTEKQPLFKKIIGKILGK